MGKAAIPPNQSKTLFSTRELLYKNIRRSSQLQQRFLQENHCVYRQTDRQTQKFLWSYNKFKYQMFFTLCWNMTEVLKIDIKKKKNVFMVFSNCTYRYMCHDKNPLINISETKEQFFFWLPSETKVDYGTCINWSFSRSLLFKVFPP